MFFARQILGYGAGPTLSGFTAAGFGKTANAAAPQYSSVEVKSTPDGADITLDDKYMGSAPSTLKRPAGDQKIKLEKSGFKTWERTLTVATGATATVNPTLPGRRSSFFKGDVDKE